MRAYGVVEKVYTFLTIALDGVEESASCSVFFNPRERA